MSEPLQRASSRRGAWFTLGLACAWGLLCMADSTVAASAAIAPSTHTVVIDGVKFEPEALSVKRGDTVVWVNKDPFPHTVTAPGAFDSHSIAAGKTWKYVARKAGDYSYVCTLHSNMKGTLKVE
jgi:plastocyanin